MADSAQGLQLRELKDTISELNKLIKTLQQTVEAVSIREAELRQERDNLKEQIDYLTKRLFGAS
ncbi:IS66 family transposase, partial [Weissella cibaria]|nr:IS66 family transposase [Weissella cibaria]